MSNFEISLLSKNVYTASYKAKSLGTLYIEDSTFNVDTGNITPVLIRAEIFGAYKSCNFDTIKEALYWLLEQDYEKNAGLVPTESTVISMLRNFPDALRAATESIWDTSDNKISAIKFYRSASGLGLKESKDIVESWRGY